MRTQYHCIGGYIQTDGLAMVRFDLDGDTFSVLACEDIPRMPSYNEIAKIVEQLCSVKPVEFPDHTVDILCNFTSDLKTTIDKRCSALPIRQKSTDIDLNNSLMNIYNVMAEKRFVMDRSLFGLSDSLEAAITFEPQASDPEKKRPLKMPVIALLHSVGWLEGQLIKHSVV